MKNTFYTNLLLAFCAPLSIMAKTGTVVPLNSTYHQPVQHSNHADPLLMKKNDISASHNLFFIENKGQVTDQYFKSRTDIQYKLSAGNRFKYIYWERGAIHYQFSKEENADQVAAATQGSSSGKPLPKDVTYAMCRMDVELIGANKQAKVIVEGKQDYFGKLLYREYR